MFLRKLYMSNGKKILFLRRVVNEIMCSKPKIFWRPKITLHVFIDSRSRELNYSRIAQVAAVVEGKICSV